VAAATTTPIEVCNLALLYVGNGQTINDFDEATQEAKACKVFYVKARDALLQSFPWSFATKRSALAALSTPDVETSDARTGWSYSYALPSDCLSPRRLWAGARTPASGDRIPFAIEGVLLLTDEEDAELTYTFQESTVARWSPLFVEALAWALAMKLCLILPVRPEWAKNAKTESELAWRKAGAADHRASQEDPPPPSEYTSVR